MIDRIASGSGESMPPLVSCIMPTYGRPDYVSESVALFLAQDYPAKELLILNDCPGQVLKYDHTEVRIINRETRYSNLGDKRNAMIELARGEYIAVWDDDDVYLPWRLSVSMGETLARDLDFYCPADYWAYWNREALQDDHCVPGWFSHALWTFRKSLWKESGGYPPITLGEDRDFYGRLNTYRGKPADSPIETCRIARHDRFMILRGKSRYHHTSIAGGQNALDTAPRCVSIAARPIADKVLAEFRDQLIQTRETAWRLAQRFAGEATRRSATIEKHPGGRFLDTLSRWPDSEAGAGPARLSNHDQQIAAVCGKTFEHAVSLAAPSSCMFVLNSAYTHFRAQVAFPDDAPARQGPVTCLVLGDDQVIGVAGNIRPGRYPRSISADVSGIERLALVADASQRSDVRLMWIDPILWSTPDRRPAGATDCDCLGLAEFDCAGNIPAATICLATVVSPGFEDWLDDMLGSFQAHGRCLDAVIAVYTFDESAEMRRIITRHGAYAIPCRMNQDAVCPTTSVLYSAARHVCADYYLCLDADLLVLGDLRPLTAAIDVLPPGTVLVGRDALPQEHLAASLTGLYGGSLEDFAKITGEEPGPEELNYPLVVNDGVLLARRAGLAALDEAVRGMPGAQDWIMKDPGKSWQNQFLLNLALARLNCGVELDESFNVQLNCREVVFSESCGRLSCRFNSRAANIVHFNGGGRSKYTEWRGRFR